MVAEIVDMDTNKRKLVTVRDIANIEPIEGADAIEVVTVEGWKVVVKKGEFSAGDKCVYFEIDSFLPTGNPAWQFLVDKSGRTFEGAVGHRLRTVKLRGQISQGFVVPLAALPQITNIDRDVDQSELLGIKKWEQPLPAELAGQAEGLFPSWMRKTDQERCQNLGREIFQTEDVLVAFDDSALTDEARQTMIEKDLLVYEDGAMGEELFKVLPAKADPEALYEITMKLDGSSATFFHRDGEVGVCSRNLQLKVNDENKDNTFVRMLHDSGLGLALAQLGNIAIQGELMGPGIQGNREQLKRHQLYIFDVQNLDTGEYLTPYRRHRLMDKLTNLGVNTAGLVFHVPVLTGHGFDTNVGPEDSVLWKLHELRLNSIDDLLGFAEGKSITHLVREGIVFKRVDGGFSFKAISNQFLLKEKD